MLKSAPKNGMAHILQVNKRRTINRGRRHLQPGATNVIVVLVGAIIHK